ncbi:hypothetical protein [uncultured Shewanella sp.]|uniref:hypothetical protein n=1 Tax=uncultured Shewanella sp. TaxID=173975 RepID=UPI00261EC1BA|nr:hypothetical protein [uncultured Shewanella sp.]
MQLHRYTQVVNLLPMSEKSRERLLTQLFYQTRGIYTHITLDKFISLFGQAQDRAQKVKLYFENGKIVGFTSWRVHRVKLANGYYDVHRSVYMIKPHCRNADSEKFLLSEIIKYNFTHLFSKATPVFLCSSEGPVTYYIMQKYVPNIYPVASNEQDRQLHQLALNLVKKLNLPLRSEHPITITPVCKINDDTLNKKRWLTRKDDSVKYYLKHCPEYLDDNHTDNARALIILFKCGFLPWFKSMFNFIRHKGVNWFSVKNNNQKLHTKTSLITNPRTWFELGFAALVLAYFTF